MMKTTAMRKSSVEKVVVIFEIPFLNHTVSPPEGWTGAGYISAKHDLLLARNTEEEAPAFLAREFKDFAEPGIYKITGKLLGNCETYRIEASDLDEEVPAGPVSIDIVLAGGEPLRFKCSLTDDNVQSYLAIKGFKVSRY